MLAHRKAKDVSFVGKGKTEEPGVVVELDPLLEGELLEGVGVKDARADGSRRLGRRNCKRRPRIRR